MGGTIAVTLRKPDGIVHKMARWTNPLPEFVTNLAMINKDPSHVDEWMEQWNGMAKDWDDHLPEIEAARKKYGDKFWDHLNVKFRFPMTACYGGYRLLAPTGYGLVVIDQQKNHILTSQGYCSFGVVHAAGISLDVPYDKNTFDENAIKALKGRCLPTFVELVEAGRVKKAVGLRVTSVKGGKSRTSQVDKSVEGMGLVELVEMALYGCDYNRTRNIKVKDPTFRMMHFAVDMSPYTIIDYEREENGWKLFRDKLIELGFPLTEEDEKEWGEWNKYIEELNA